MIDITHVKDELIKKNSYDFDEGDRCVNHKPHFGHINHTINYVIFPFPFSLLSFLSFFFSLLPSTLSLTLSHTGKNTLNTSCNMY